MNLFYFLRSIVFDIFFYINNFLCTFLGMFLLFLPRRYIVKLSFLWSKNALWLMKILLGLTYTFEGKKNLPEGSFIIASKHQSAWETVAFCSFFKDPIFILKKSLLHIPFFGWGLKKIGVLPVERGKKKGWSHLVMQAQKMTAEGRPLIIFPEGTRTLPEQNIQYKRGVWLLYQKLNLPIIPIALNSGFFWKRRAWIKKPGKISVVCGEPLPPGLKDEGQFFAWLRKNIEFPTQKPFKEQQ